ncbi:MAG: glycosyltransferase family 87 protein [Gaiellaceae bacterium]
MSAATVHRDADVRSRARWYFATLRSWATVTSLAVAPLALLIALLAMVIQSGRSGSDFATFWESGNSVLRGASPFPAVSSLPQVADRTSFLPFVYPPPAAFLMVPLSLLPFSIANVLLFFVNVGSIGLALRFLGVRDWRCYGIAFLCAPVVAALLIGTISPLLLLGVAAAWRYRERTLLLGVLVAGVVALKLFLWPLGIWLLGARRRSAAVVAGVTVVVTTLGAWLAIGFSGFREYPRLLGRLTELVGTNSYSSYALQRAAGVSSSAAQLALIAVSIVLAIATAISFRRQRDEASLLVAAIGIALLTTPILWPHYLVLLFVPVAFASRTLSALWLLPLLLWLDATTWSNGEPVRIIPVLVGTLVIICIALRRSGRRPAAIPVPRAPAYQPALPSFE